MLLGMRDALAAATPEAAASFASFLASLANVGEESAAAAGADRDRWDLDDLADDVATIGSVDLRLHEENVLARGGTSLSQVRTHGPGAPISVPDGQNGTERNDRAQRKSASVTMRMTGGECAQLHQRAAEAGLTVSAYLRSCAFEVETLRAQVKEALAQLSAAAVQRSAKRRRFR